MKLSLSPMRHVRGFDVVRPFSIGTIIAIMLPLVLLPLASIFYFGMKNGVGSFWAALTAPEAIFALKLSVITSFWATVFNVIFSLFAAFLLSRPASPALRAASVVGAIRHAGSSDLSLRRRCDVHGVGCYPRQYLCHVSAGVWRHQARLRHDEPITRRSIGDHRRNPLADFLARHVDLASRANRPGARFYPCRP